MKHLPLKITVCKMPKGIPWALVGEYEIVFPVKGGLKKVKIKDVIQEVLNLETTK